MAGWRGVCSRLGGVGVAVWGRVGVAGWRGEGAKMERV